MGGIAGELVQALLISKDVQRPFFDGNGRTVAAAAGKELLELQQVVQGDENAVGVEEPKFGRPRDGAEVGSTGGVRVGGEPDPEW
jgi:hypothetical protein